MTETTRHDSTAAPSTHRGWRALPPHFVRHYLEMVAAMLAGMLVFGAVRMGLGAATGTSAFFDRLEPMVLAMATEMSLGMVVWMRYRRHSWSATLQMCAAMYAPFLLLLAPHWAGLVSADTVMVGGHVLMLPAMALVMLRTHRH